MTIVWSPRAIEHLAHLRDYIARDNPKVANRIASALLDAVERLAVARPDGRLRADASVNSRVELARAHR